ncbi:anti-phage Hailong system nucleotidyltransferase HalB [Paraburkholderia sp. D1E]|uniref:anti-phage Hailong system nucleotidyltransferase HalB n=1 Tax=Paraburkholderia sp. D1E TaxID=3461398 RepID=UPI00404527F3
MTITSLALYGSRARQDEDIHSDIDLFAISTDLQYQMIVQKNTNIASYPRPLAFERARQGDLFMLHIVNEAQVLYDPTNEFSQLKETFTFKGSYDSEIQFASDIAWMLIDNSSTSNNFSFLNRRIAWCVRTILIARGANLQRPIFSASKLAEFSASDLTLPLIKGKSSNEARPGALDALEAFLKKFGGAHPFLDRKTSLIEYAGYFAGQGNVMGSKTLTMLQSTAEDFYS